MTAPSKNALGLVGFPTPDNPDESGGYLVFLFPDKTWPQWILGALENLVYEWNWYEAGEMSPADAADAFRLIIQQAPYNLLPATIPAPYWDEITADDADAEAPILSQIWYGKIVTMGGFIAEDVTLSFVEDAFIWTVAGFIAYAGLPAQAIAFVPIARKFVLSFKRSPNGSIVNILADFLHLADIDTYGVEDSIANISIVMPDDATTLYVVQADESNPDVVGTPTMAVIRRELAEADVSNPAYRYNSDCDCVQYSPDGGTTWNDAMGSDPRHVDAFRKPIRAGSNKRCNAAANAVKWVKDVIDECTAILGTGAIVVTLINKILQFAEYIFAEAGGELLNLILTISGALFDIGSAALMAAFNPTQYALLLCIFDCAMDDNGQVNAVAFTYAQSQVTAKLNTTAAIVVNLFLSLQGQVGVSNAGAVGVEVGDCSDCDCTWCYAYLWQTGSTDNWNLSGDFQGTAMSGHQIFVSPDYQMAGVTSSGIPSRLYMYTQLHAEALADFHITGWALEWIADDVYGDTSELLRFFNAAGDVVYTYDAGIGDHGSQARTTTTITGLDIMAAYCVIRLEARDYGVCYNLKMTGDDVSPFPGSNC